MNGIRDSTETLRLLERVRGGQTQALDELLARHRSGLRKAIELRMDRRLRSRVDPSDVLQETQLDVCNRLDDYLVRQPMPFHLWIRKTASERLAKLRERHLKAAKRSVEREASLPDQTSMQLARRLWGTRSSPSEQANRREMITIVQRALAELSEADREILLMRYLEQLSNHEIGHVLEIEPSTVSKRHGRALLRLEAFLRQSGLRRGQ